ncbi:LysR family transcriptional regulator [Streptomyces sp. NPDC059008]|uniref:LysR family transcriptional regulator n=1 Tax=Streptomyces sp. NPDC059008 TaxID=3346693 RepID=UPI003693A934
MTTDPSTHQLRLLLVLAEELHFGRAAKRLFISQPAFSRQIRMLEEHLGVALVERSTRRVALTPAGEALLPRVRAVVDAVEELHGAADALSHPQADRVVLGSYISALPALRILFDRVCGHLPGPGIEWRDVDNVEQVSALVEGKVDAVVCYGPMPDGIHTLQLGTEARYVCLPDTHPLADRDSLTLAELADLPVIGYSPDVDARWRAFWAADPRPDGTPVRYSRHTATTLESAVSAVSLGHGIRFLSEGCLDLMPRPGIRYLAVTDLAPCIAVLAWSAERPRSPALSSFQMLLRDYADTINRRWNML